MRLATLMLAAALSFPAIAAPSYENHSSVESSTVIAMDVPGTQYRKPDPTFPERSQEEPPTWDDTADTSDDLRHDVDSTENEAEVKPEQDLNNDVHDPLLESPILEPGERPLHIPGDPLDDEPHNPLSEPLP